MGQEGSKDGEGFQDQPPAENGGNNRNITAPKQRKNMVKSDESGHEVERNGLITQDKQERGASATVSRVPAGEKEQKLSVSHGFDEELRLNQRMISDKLMTQDLRKVNEDEQMPTTEGEPPRLTSMKEMQMARKLNEITSDSNSSKNQDIPDHQNVSNEKPNERPGLSRTPQTSNDVLLLGEASSSIDKSNSSPKSNIEKKLESHSLRLAALMKKSPGASGILSGNPMASVEGANKLKTKTYECIEYKAEYLTETTPKLSDEVCIYSILDIF